MAIEHDAIAEMVFSACQKRSRRARTRAIGARFCARTNGEPRAFGAGAAAAFMARAVDPFAGINAGAVKPSI